MVGKCCWPLHGASLRHLPVRHNPSLSLKWLQNGASGHEIQNRAEAEVPGGLSDAGLRFLFHPMNGRRFSNCACHTGRAGERAQAISVRSNTSHFWNAQALGQGVVPLTSTCSNNERPAAHSAHPKPNTSSSSSSSSPDTSPPSAASAACPSPTSSSPAVSSSSLTTQSWPAARFAA